jgi:hypothetical protein
MAEIRPMARTLCCVYSCCMFGSTGYPEPSVNKFDMLSLPIPYR